MSERVCITREEALRIGLKTFFTGEKCSRGHVAPQYVIGRRCTVCRRLEAVERGRSDGANELGYLTAAQRRGRKSTYSNLMKDPERWFAQVEGIRRGKRYVFGSNAEQLRKKPLKERTVIFVPPMAEDLDRV